MLSPYVLDEREGTLEIDYLVYNFTASERLSVFINGEERCKFFILGNGYRLCEQGHRGGEAIHDEVLLRA